MQNNCFEASKYSELFWNEWKLNPDNTGYNIRLVYKLKGDFDIAKFISCINTFINKNAAYRSYFYKNDEDILCLCFVDSIENTIQYYDLSNKVEQKEEVIKRYINDTIYYKFDLSKPPLFRITLLKTSINEYVLILVFHHIISDGTSILFFVESVSKLYNDIPFDLTDNYLNRFKSYLKYEKSVLRKKEIFTESVSYWTELLKESSSAFDFSHFCNNQAAQANHVACYRFEIRNSLLKKIGNFSNKRKISLFNIVSAVWGILLYRYFNENDFAITYPVNIRPSEFADLPGSFVNIIPFRVKINFKDCFNSLLEYLVEQRRNSKKFQNAPFQNVYLELCANNTLKKGVKHFNVILADTASSSLLKPNFNCISVEPIHFPLNAPATLSLEYSYRNNVLIFQISFDTKFFSSNFIKAMAEHFKFILSRSIDSPFENINSYLLLLPKEYQQIIYDWNNTESPYPKDKTIQQLFEEQVEETPDNIAVIFEDKRLTYRELNEKANQLAHLIRDIYRKHFEREIEADNLIGIYIERSLEMMVGILGILKAGGSYVPLGTSEPKDRLKYKIEDSNCRIILTSLTCKKNLTFVSGKNRKIVPIDMESGKISEFPVTNPSHINTSKNLAYVIYTSGSTGQPKGVMIEHKSVINFLYSLNSIKKLKIPFNGFLACNYVFDVSVHDIFSVILYGGTLYICDKYISASAELFYEILKKEFITSTYIPHHILKDFCSIVLKNKDTLKLERALVGVEPINHDILVTLVKKIPALTIINGYGPTEATICSSFYKVVKQLKYFRTPIGKPLNNTSAYILDINLNPVPVGVPGELYIGGDGLARGYLNKPELTKERFITNPFVSEKDKAKRRNLRLYKTGDMVKWLPDGNIEYIGRNDFQIKIRGFRIELGEIENKLLEHPSIKQAVVIVHGRDEDKKLAAYYTLKEKSSEAIAKLPGRAVSTSLRGKLRTCGVLRQPPPQRGRPTPNFTTGLSVEDLRDYLCSVLPEYMVPSYLVELENMPLNTSGKIDRKNLPEPVMEVDKSTYVSPGNEAEKKLCHIWQELLKVDKVGIDDHFFRIGGHSISAIDLISRINKEFNIDLSVSWIFANNTARKQAENLNSQNKTHIKLNDIPASIENDIKLPEDIVPEYRKDVSLFYEKPEKILLTGVTGFLGTHLLVELLEQTNAIIYCLVRSPLKRISMEDKLKDSLHSYKLKNNITDEQISRIILINGTLGKAKLGLSDSDYDFITSSIDSIYHCGAMVNHLYDYELLKYENTFSVIELIKIAFNYKPKTLHFISSICGVNNIDKNGYVIEYPLSVTPLTGSTGYALSKWAAEQLMDQAFKRGLHGSVIRPGNIFVNSKTGVMSKHEKNFSMLLMESFIRLCKAPDIDNYRFEAIPVNVLARIIILISLNKISDNMFLNLCNLKTLSLDEYLSVLEKIAGVKIAKLPYSQWCEEINLIKSDDPLYYLKHLVDSNRLDKANFKFETSLLEKILRQLKIDLDFDYKELLSSVIIGSK